MFRLVMVVMALGLLCGCGSAVPGRAIDWSVAGNSSPSSSPVPISVATPSPSGSASGAGGWSSIWSNLNSNTAEVARGQYGLLGELEHTVGDYINGMLATSH